MADYYFFFFIKPENTGTVCECYNTMSSSILHIFNNCLWNKECCTSHETHYGSAFNCDMKGNSYIHVKEFMFHEFHIWSWNPSSVAKNLFSRTSLPVTGMPPLLPNNHMKKIQSL